MLKWLSSIDKRLSASKDMEKREPFCTVGGKRQWYEVSSKTLKIELSHDSIFALLGIYPPN